jgi:3-methyladenine DNA glycosylase AlkD
MKEILEKVRGELLAASDIKAREAGERYFREEVKLYGIKAKQVREIARDNFMTVRKLDKAQIMDLCEMLWQSGMIEESIVACLWTEKLTRQFTPADFETLQRWVFRYVSNWASCDTLCNHTVGDFIQMYPAYLTELRKWARSGNRWVRRASAVTLIVPARRGKFLEEIFEIAGILLEDKDDMVQKGYGWMLKAASEAHQQEVFEFVMRHKACMPRTALRYAIEKMPADLRSEAMAR